MVELGHNKRIIRFIFVLFVKSRCLRTNLLNDIFRIHLGLIHYLTKFMCVRNIRIRMNQTI